MGAYPRQGRAARQRSSMFSTLLAMVAIVELLLSVPGLGAIARIPGIATLLVIVAFGLLAGLIFDTDRTSTVVAVLGVIVLAVTLGFGGTLDAVVIVGLMTWLFVAARKLRNGRV